MERNRKKKRKDEGRRRRSSSESSVEDGGMPQWKTGLVVAVIIVCFAMLYPKMFHPMFMTLLGMNRPQNQEPEKRFAPGPLNPADSHIHAGPPHPGMRMGGGQTADQRTTSGKGMWPWMLPCYTIGVVVFLLYTLSKIMLKPRNRRSRKYDMRYNSRRERFEVDDGGVHTEEESNDEEDLPVTGSPNLNKRELRLLQKRLKHTESAMNTILQQLEQVTQASEPVVAEAAKKITMNTLNQLSQVEMKSAKFPPVDSESEEDEEEYQDVGYLQDLEKALHDFKNLSDAYTATALKQKQMNECLNKSDTEKEEGERLEGCESEDVNNLVMEPSEGEIINLNEGMIGTETKRVRKRKI